MISGPARTIVVLVPDWLTHRGNTSPELPLRSYSFDIISKSMSVYVNFCAWTAQNYTRTEKTICKNLGKKLLLAILDRSNRYGRFGVLRNVATNRVGQSVTRVARDKQKITEQIFY